jgi:IstB-like ATP binding protein
VISVKNRSARCLRGSSIAAGTCSSRAGAICCNGCRPHGADLRLPAELAKLDRFDLLVLDDVSYVKRDQAETSALFEPIAERYERRSLALTANQPFSAWYGLFPSRHTGQDN